MANLILFSSDNKIKFSNTGLILFGTDSKTCGACVDNAAPAQMIVSASGITGATCPNGEYFVDFTDCSSSPAGTWGAMYETGSFYDIYITRNTNNNTRYIDVYVTNSSPAYEAHFRLLETGTSAAWDCLNFSELAIPFADQAAGAANCNFSGATLKLTAA